MSALLPDLLLRATFVLLTAWVVATCLSRSGAASLHLIWLAALAALPVMPLAMILLPPLPWLPGITQLAADTGGQEVVASKVGLPWWVWCYGLGAVALLLRLAYGRVLLFLLWRKAGSVTPQTSALTQRLQAEFGIARNVVVRLSADSGTPMTWGSVRPKILLPQAALYWDEARLRVVLLHELAHVRRLDILAHSMSGLCCALFWPHPLVWFAARRLVLLQEQASDDLVLGRGVLPEAYCRLLLTMADETRIGLIATPAMLATPLEKRFESILTPRRRSGAGRILGIAIFGGGLAFTGFASVIVPAVATPAMVVAVPDPPKPRSEMSQQIAPWAAPRSPVPSRVAGRDRQRAIAPQVPLESDGAIGNSAAPIGAPDLARGEVRQMMGSWPVPPSRSPALGYRGPSGPLPPYASSRRLL